MFVEMIELSGDLLPEAVDNVIQVASNLFSI
jgi:hypothetical protein